MVEQEYCEGCEEGNALACPSHTCGVCYDDRPKTTDIKAMYPHSFVWYLGARRVRVMIQGKSSKWDRFVFRRKYNPSNGTSTIDLILSPDQPPFFYPKDRDKFINNG